MPPTDPREHARYLAVQAGRQSCQSRGLDEWDSQAMDVALEAERAFLEQHHIRQTLPGEDVAE